jgi:hypothetical protein
VTKLAGNVRPTEVTLRSESHGARIGLSAPLYHRRLCPGPRKIKQALFLVVAFSVAGRKHGFIGVLPELICCRHGTFSVPRHRPNGSLHVSLVTVCSK